MDLLGSYWLNFTPDNVEVEIKAAMWRNMVEEKHFSFGCFEEFDEVEENKFLNE